MAEIARNVLGDIKNGLVAVISKSANLSDVRHDLSQQGLLEQSEFFLTQEDAEDLELVSEGVLKTLRKALAINMVEIEEQLVQAVKTGDIVIYIGLENNNDNLKRQAQALLERHQASFVHHFGPWSVSTVSASG